MALDVFHHHVPKDYQFDPSTSGAEWWVQIRPSPPSVGRYSMHDPQPDGMSKTGISFHWDKDEDLRLLAGGSLYVHPYLSTVTYLTDLGAPTMVVNCRVNYATGEWILPEETVEGFVSWPRQGKHLSFDGRFLHAAPPDLMEDGLFERQCKIPEEEEEATNDPKAAERRRKILERRHRRVTFLVNVWLNYKPFNVELFPDTMIDKLTKVDESKWKGVFASGKCDQEKERCVSLHDNEVRDEQLQPEDDRLPQAFTWPMGDCDSNEMIQMQMPRLSIRREASVAGNIHIVWKGSNGVRLFKDTKQQAASDQGASQGNGGNNASGSSIYTESSQSNAKRIKVDTDDGNVPYRNQ